MGRQEKRRFVPMWQGSSSVAYFFHGLAIPFSEIEMIFGVSKVTVLKRYQRELSERQKVGRRLCTDSETWQQLKTVILERSEGLCPMTTEDAIDLLSMSFGLRLLPDTLRTKVSLDHELRRITGVPLEKERLACDPEEIAAYFELFDRNVAGIPAAFVFNLDESGFQDWADPRERMVIVPATVHDNKIGIPVNWTTRRSSLLVCIAADGPALRPMLILPRKTTERELFEQGINEEIGMLVSQDHGFIT
jgi:hypothetical protein